jgi:hypothetical protein
MREFSRDHSYDELKTQAAQDDLSNGRELNFGASRLASQLKRYGDVTLVDAGTSLQVLLLRLALCYKFRMRKSLLVVVAFCIFGCCAFGQTDTALPTVTAFECPKYPAKGQSIAPAFRSWG